MFQDEGKYITREEFGGGYILFALDLTPDACDGPNFNLMCKNLEQPSSGD